MWNLKEVIENVLYWAMHRSKIQWDAAFWALMAVGAMWSIILYAVFESVVAGWVLAVIATVCLFKFIYWLISDS